MPFVGHAQIVWKDNLLSCWQSHVAKVEKVGVLNFSFHAADEKFHPVVDAIKQFLQEI